MNHLQVCRIIHAPGDDLVVNKLPCKANLQNSIVEA